MKRGNFVSSFCPTFLFTAALAFLPALGGCSSESAAPGPTEWAGSDPHAQLSGNAGGLAVDVSLGAEAADTSVVSCKREYRVPDPNDPSTFSQGVLGEIELEINVTKGGIVRTYSLEIAHADLSKVAAGAELSIEPAQETGGPSKGAVWVELEYEWEEGGDFVSYEKSAISGTFVLGELTGTPGTDGLVIPDGEGTIGGFIRARISETEELTASFTAKCGTNDVEM